MQWLKSMRGSLGRIGDRRRGARVPDPAILAFYCAGAEALPHRVRDISRTGAYMYTEERWYLGTLVQITLDIDATRAGKKNSKTLPSITLWSKVVRHDKDGIGLEFVLVQQKRRESLHKFLAGVHSSTHETNPE